MNICGLLFTPPKNYKACSKPTMDMSSKGGYALVYKYTLVEREVNCILSQKCIYAIKFVR